MYSLPGPFDLENEEGIKQPFARIRKYGGACGHFVANCLAAVLVLGIVLLMRVTGKETRY